MQTTRPNSISQLVVVSMLPILVCAGCGDIVAPDPGWTVAEESQEADPTVPALPTSPPGETDVRVLAEPEVDVLEPREWAPADGTSDLRAVYPPHGSTIANSRPRFRWRGDVEVTISICSQSSWCRVEAVTERGTGGSHRISTPLEPGLYWWRAQVDDRYTWPSSFVVTHGAHGDAPQTHWGHRNDLQGDGAADIVAGDPRFESERGRVGVIHYASSSRSAGAIAWFDDFGREPASRSGWSVTTADTDADGQDELIAGRPGPRDDAGSWAGAINVHPWWYRGSYRVDAPPAEATRFGWSVTSVGDVDGDGFGDVAVGASGEAASVHVLYGGRERSLGTRRDRLVPDGDASSFGTELAGPLDANDDGYSDFLIGDPGYEGSGRVFVVFGGPNGPTLGDAIVAWDASDDFGHAIAIGDVDGDGRPDFVVGEREPCITLFTSLDGPGFERARHCGGFGYAGELSSVALADDDGDGRAAVFTGYVDEDDASKGRITRWTLRDDGTAAEESRYSPREPGNCVGRSMSSPGDVDRDGLADVVASRSACSRQSTTSGVILFTAASVELIEGEGSWGEPLAR